MDKNCSSSCHFFFCFVLKSNNNKWAFAGSHTKKTHFTMITHKSWGLHYSPARMICAIRGSLCVVQIVIKKPSKEICDLKRVFYPQHMTDVTVISYLLPANLSAQQARGRQKAFFPPLHRHRCRLWSIGGSVLPQKDGCQRGRFVRMAALAEEGWRLFLGFN